MDKTLGQTKRQRAAPARKAATARSVRVDGASTRTLILQAARRRLIEQGYASLNVRDIAADAGVNHALIGYHFRGKHQLVLAVLDDANTRLLERQSGMYEQPATASRKWEQACEFYEEDLASGFVMLLMQLMGASFHDEVLRKEFLPRFLQWQKLIETAVDEFIRTHGLKLPMSGRAITAWITYFWVGMEASMALGVPEEQGYHREALQAMTVLLKQVEGARAPRDRKRK